MVLGADKKKIPICWKSFFGLFYLDKHQSHLQFEEERKYIPNITIQ